MYILIYLYKHIYVCVILGFEFVGSRLSGLRVQGFKALRCSDFLCGPED